MSSQSSESADLKPLDLPDIKDYTHLAHRFPGKFHPPLVNHIINKYGDEHDVIADPMCGSGTAGLEAVIAGKDAICNDIDPLSALITRGKTNPVDPILLRSTSKNIIEGIGQMPKEGSFDEETAIEKIQSNIDGKDYTIPYNVFHWFEPHVAVGYSRLLTSAHDELQGHDSGLWDAVHTALAAMVRQISRADPEPVSGLEVTSVRKEELEEGVEFDVIGSFRNVLNRLARGYQELQEAQPLGDITVFESDCRYFSDMVDEVDLSPTMIVTSPPYCNAIEYSRRHRLEYEWLGLFNNEDVDDPRNERIETSRDFFGSTTPRQDTLRGLDEVPHPEVRELTATIEQDGYERKSNLLRKYFLDAYEWIDEIRNVLRVGGLFCLIVGPSTSYGQTVNTPKWLKDISVELDFEVHEEMNYLLKNNKMQFPTDGETTDTESLIVLKAV